MSKKEKTSWKEKSLWNKFSDLFLVVIIIAMLFPQGRMAIGGFINRLKASVYNPTHITKENQIQIKNLDWPLINTKGESINLNDYKGKVLFINLWATWCPPCVGEMPEIQDLHQHFANEDQIEFLMISNEEFSKINPFMEQRDYSFPVYSSQSKAPPEFNSTSIPTTFLVSKTGEIVIRETGAANWNSQKMIDLINGMIKE